MASETYSIKVISIRDNIIRLKLTIISPDEYYFYEKKNFALQVLWDSAQNLPDSILKKTISEDQILNSEWVLKHQDEFIEDVKTIETSNYPDKNAISKMNREMFDNFRKENGTPEAV